MAESETKSAELNDIAPEDFVRFLEYAYRGDYSVPPWTHHHSANLVGQAALHGVAPTPDEIPSKSTKSAANAPRYVPILHLEAPVDENTISRSDNEQVASILTNHAATVQEQAPAQYDRNLVYCTHKEWDCRAHGSLEMIRKKKAMHKAIEKSVMEEVMARVPLIVLRESAGVVALRTRFEDRVYLPLRPLDLQARASIETLTNTSATDDYTGVFLAHARLYTFADKWLVYPLKGLVLEKIHKTVVNFRLYPQRLGDVVKLARYAYDNGSDRWETRELDDLRQLVVACEVDSG